MKGAREKNAKGAAIVQCPGVCRAHACVPRVCGAVMDVVTGVVAGVSLANPMMSDQRKMSALTIMPKQGNFISF
ncbi:hypothetical protein [Allofranklinella schreckenbergeri]|uniref:hypothetical protein n=1 Tax=Allofranklinella schreckenbergeri TaxID=1076744 RepID=UPI0011C34C6B|nr:hypothetical protein [Allofranklinella schreckenbergeri]